MEIIVQKSELTKALGLTQSVVERKTTMPILANILITASEGELKLAASDLEITAVSKVRAEIKTSGSTTVNAKVFNDIVRELPDAEVHLKLTEGERLELISEKTRVKMIGVSADEYPSLPGISFETRGQMQASQLSEMVSKTLYAVSNDETRFNLNGVCFSLEKPKKGPTALRMVATDGHRLALITRASGSLDFEGDVIVPKKGLGEVKRVLDEHGDNPVGIDIMDGFLILDTGETKISMRLIDGEFPDYNQVMPKGEGETVVLQSGPLGQAMKRVALMVTDKGKCVKLDFAKGALRISSSSPELGEAHEELEIDYAGEPISIGFNAKYVLDFANSLGEARNLCLDLHGALGPGRFYAENDESYIGIVMPMRLS